MDIEEILDRVDNSNASEIEKSISKNLIRTIGNVVDRGLLKSDIENKTAINYILQIKATQIVHEALLKRMFTGPIGNSTIEAVEADISRMYDSSFQQVKDQFESIVETVFQEKTNNN